MADIAGPADLQLLLREFYARAFDDELLRHVFVDVAHMDLDAHIPVLAAFWEKVLFGTGTYSGRAMAVHRDLHAIEPLTDEHFTRWLELWTATICDNFHGRYAMAAQSEAARIASVFLRNLHGAQAGGMPVVPGGPLLPIAPFAEPAVHA